MGDIETNPGPSQGNKKKKTRMLGQVCDSCGKTVERNQKLLSCCDCCISVHYKCEAGRFGVDITNWKCTLCELPKLFTSVSSGSEDSMLSSTPDLCPSSMQLTSGRKTNENMLSIAQLITQLAE